MSHPTNCCAHQKMRISLGGVRVTAESDGGFSLQPNPALRCMYPVFSIEVLLPHELPVLIFLDET